jgi:hypothetical protein
MDTMGNKTATCKCVLFNDPPGPSLKPGERYIGSDFNSYGEAFCHTYEQDMWDEFPLPQTRCKIFEVKTATRGYGMPYHKPPQWE